MGTDRDDFARNALGGLLTSMMLKLLVLPALALRYGRFRRPAADPLEQ